MSPRRLLFFRRASTICVIALALFALPSGGQMLPPCCTMISRGGVPTSYWATSGSINAEYVSWTQAAGIQYTGVSIGAGLCGVGGTGSGTAYLYSAPGTSGTLTASATLIASSAVSVTTAFPTSNGTTLFSNLTLSAGSTPVTYYVVLLPSNASLAWETSATALTTTVELQ